LRACLTLAVALALSAGCAAIKPTPEDPGLFLLQPKDAGLSISLSQSITLRKGPRIFEALAAVEVAPDHVSLAALGPLGNRMLALRWDGKTLEQEKDPSLPPELPLGLILRDLQAAFWPAGAVRGGLPKGWTLDETPLQRQLSLDGRPVLRIRYAGADHWHSALHFEHLGLGYSLDISPLPD
jgi:hypothetical protein